MSQRLLILKWLKRKPITARDAMLHLGCYRLAARIHELRAQGWHIETRMVPHDGGEHAKYYLEDEG